MKNLCKSFGIAALLAAAGAAHGQVYTSSPNLPILDVATVSDTIAVAGGPTSLTSVTVQITLTHTWDSDLDIALVHNGQYLLLTTDNGGSGDNYTATLFSDTAGASITTGTAPFTGTFLAEGGTAAGNGWGGTPNPPAATNLTNLAGWNSQDGNGSWQLVIGDDAAGDVGVLQSWTLTLAGSSGSSTNPFGTMNFVNANNCGTTPSTMTINVTPGTLPPSTGITVTGNLSSIGGPASVAFLDNGVAPDVTANDNIFTRNYTVPAAFAVGSYSVPFTVSDAQARSSTGSGSVTVISCPPVNDDCSGATALADGSNAFTGMTVASTSLPHSTCNGGDANDLWFTFTAGPAGGPVRFDTCSNPSGANTFYDSVLSVYSGTCGALTEMDCSDDFGGTCGTFGYASSVTPVLAPNQTVYIRLAAYSAFAVADGTGILTVTTTLPLGIAGGFSNAVELTPAFVGAFVTPGSNPTSTGIVATADLSSIGGSATQQLYDDGTHGDDVAGDGTYLFLYNLPISVQSGVYVYPVSVLDGQGRTAAATSQLTVTDGPNGACCTAGVCAIARETTCFAGSGTFQGAGTNCGGTGYTIASSTSPFEDISTTGTALATVSNCDDCTENVALPFSFVHAGNAYTSVNVSSNGNLQFGASNAANFGNVPIPNTAVPNDMLAPLWDDLYTVGAGDVYTLDDSANGRFVISWQGVAPFATTNPEYNFQVVLFASGNVEFRYGSITAEAVADDYTVGWENSDGSSGGSVSGASLGTGNTALLLTPSVTPSPCGPTCDSIDFNADTLFPDTTDIDDFLSVFSGGPCSNDPSCGDIDFNNDGLFPDTLDIDAFLSVFSGGQCLV